MWGPDGAVAGAQFNPIPGTCGITTAFLSSVGQVGVPDDESEAGLPRDLQPGDTSRSPPCAAQPPAHSVLGLRTWQINDSDLECLMKGIFQIIF